MIHDDSEETKTLIEKWDEESKHYDIASSVRPLIIEFFITQFDAMLAEDIETLKWGNGNNKEAISLLEARRASLKK